MLISAVILWGLLASAVIGLAIYRKLVAHYYEDDLIHVGAGEDKLISQQFEIAETLEKVDRWGKLLTVVMAVSGVILAAFYLYNVYLDGLKLPQ